MVVKTETWKQRKTVIFWLSLNPLMPTVSYMIHNMKHCFSQRTTLFRFIFQLCVSLLTPRNKISIEICITAWFLVVLKLGSRVMCRFFEQTHHALGIIGLNYSTSKWQEIRTFVSVWVAISFHRFPTDPINQKIWEQRTKRKNWIAGHTN